MRYHPVRGILTIASDKGGLAPPACAEDPEKAFAECERLIATYHDPAKYSMLRMNIGPATIFEVEEDIMVRSAQLARKHPGVRLHTHLAGALNTAFPFLSSTLPRSLLCPSFSFSFCSPPRGFSDDVGPDACTGPVCAWCAAAAENQEDIDEGLRIGVGRPKDYMAKLGWMQSDVWCAHCCKVNDEELGMMAAAGVVSRRRRLPGWFCTAALCIIAAAPQVARWECSPKAASLLMPGACSLNEN